MECPIYKARLVVKGYQQKEEIDNTYSPVAKLETLKILLSSCCQNNLKIHQMDVETAFLNGDIKSEVYVNQPLGYDDNTNRVYKLHKALYGLKESPRMWYECFHKFMDDKGYNRAKHDYCLYYKDNLTDPVYIILFVDDLLICSRNVDKINEIKTSLSKRFCMKDEGKVKSYIGIDINYDEATNVMSLSQERYINSLVKKYKLETAKPYKSPMETNLRLEPAETINSEIKYRTIIGELLYISSGTRPDIAYSVNSLSRFQRSYDNSHFKYALRILKYLNSTKEVTLTYRKTNEIDVLDCLVDSGWAGDIVDRNSTTGYLIRLYGNIIFWKSRKQKTVTKSSTAAEYVALSEAITEVEFVKGLINEVFKIEIKKPIKVYEDNSGAVMISRYGNLSKKSKHIKIQYHYVNDSVVKNEIDVVKIDSKNNLADILTKSLSKDTFMKLRHQMNLIYKQC